MQATHRAGLSLAVLALAGGPSAGFAAESADHGAKPYRIVDGAVDEQTYLGWRAFHSACHTCHGVDAVGSSVAPSLVERIRNLSAEQFAAKVLTSYRITLPASEATGDDAGALRQAFLEEILRRERGELMMPAWQYDSKIRPHLIDLYAYLRARSDGALGRGEPARIPE